MRQDKLWALCQSTHTKTYDFQKIIFFYSDGPIKLWQVFTNNYFLASHYRYIINSPTTVTQVDVWTGTQTENGERCVKQTAKFIIHSKLSWKITIFFINNGNMKIGIISNSQFIFSSPNETGLNSGKKENKQKEKTRDMISLANSHCSKIHSNIKTIHNTQEKTPSFVCNY